MIPSMTLRGVPASILHDAWWLGDGPAAPPRGKDCTSHEPRRPRACIVLPLLALAADLLFWDRNTGISAAIFAALVFTAASLHLPAAQIRRPAILLALGALPVAEYVQPLSLAFLAVALIGALVWSRLPAARAGALFGAGVDVCAALPARWIAPLTTPLRKHAETASGTAPGLRRIARNWAFPLGGGVVLAALLLQANPLLARALSRGLNLDALFLHGLFWGGVMLLCYPLLDPAPQPRTLSLPDAPRLRGLGLNGGSVLRALVLFNVMIGLQTAMDLSIFVGGAELPRGMSHAAYAHRGAYPLLATALLAGGFALAARPFVTENKALRPLLLLWLGQNAALCLSAILRLDLYIDQFGLTYLRIHALIWMALVGLGLGLTAWQVARGHTSGWLLARVMAMALGTLYAASFVNFADLIARRNIAMNKIDTYQLCALGPTAAAPIAANPQLYAALSRVYACRPQPPRASHLPEWGFRNWRVARNVVKIHKSLAQSAKAVPVK